MAARLRSREREQSRAVGSDDAYLYMLILSTVAMVIGCLFMWLDWDSWPGKPALPTVAPVSRSADGTLPGTGNPPPTTPPS